MKEDSFMEKRNTICQWVLGFVLVSFIWILPSVAQAVCDPTIIGVAGVFGTLQAAIDAAQPEETILVPTSNICNENVTVRSNITLNGGGGPLGGPPGATIDGGPGATTTTVRVTSRGVTIIGFTITGGRNGIHVVNGATAVIDGNRIHAVGTNGILVSRASSARIINNLIELNLNGSGIRINDSSAARIGFTGPGGARVSEPNIIDSNGRDGISVTRSSSARIVSNTISGNTGDGVRVRRVSHADIASNIINGNTGDGIDVGENSGVNLGRDLIDVDFDPVEDSHHTTTVNNTGFGIRCIINSYANGVLGILANNGLTGGSGDKSFSGSCVDSLIADHILP